MLRRENKKIFFLANTQSLMLIGLKKHAAGQYVSQAVQSVSVGSQRGGLEDHFKQMQYGRKIHVYLSG